MSGWPDRPVVYEVNTAVWLGELSRDAGRSVTLGDVPASAWNAVTPPGVDAVWLMGVWERSTTGLALANARTGLRASFKAALPDLRPQDVSGSPYCVRRYVVAEEFGGDDGLAQARAELAIRGVRLVLDFVPNHVAPDHPWVTNRPELFVRGDVDDYAENPERWLAIGEHVFARGRDPFFPPWPDVVQLDAFSPALRAAATTTLAGIAARCDGIRCDMAMLMTNDVFARTWGREAPEREFWPEIIDGLRDQHAETVLIAEAYWDMEWTLQQQGFAFCYDKRLYDRLVSRDVEGVRAHLRADIGYQAKLVRFLENQDEPRLAAVLPPDAAKAAAVVVATLPGATLWHEGQFEGRTVRPPVFLNRRPDEPPGHDLAAWYRHLLATVREHRLRDGEWFLLGTEGWPDNQSHRSLLAWEWIEVGGSRHVVVVNFSDSPAQARIPLDWQPRPWRFADLLGGEVFDRDLTAEGLFVSLHPWGFHVLSVA
ncbi:alpha-amylase family glycosyl hydrolase [Lentzea flaviverrucosa]|uniref:Alpha amylase, catalytic domain n=1 Tax=Lentzea flaviverrucosa TaxID=200379 RepID=A0A1H9HP62_9PSEU|nr:alpha-amylase family glycosyl hydrolase [Lentzea flaviverrucosa]RDI34524.1 alpha amylase catalytic subunit [Lentzea flaviverrucosa]SEQ64022.1 Alpha amylase, catalytic domain [Lentzea flaviverrucosa]